MYTGYSEEELFQLINVLRAEDLRKELIRKGEVLPATEDIIFKNVMMTRPGFLSIILEYFLGIDREIIKKNMRLENTSLPVNNAKEKKKVTDIIVRVGINVINLEMNAECYEGLIDRNVKYAASLLNDVTFRGEDYDNKHIVIQINFDLDWQHDDREIVKFVLMDPVNNIVLTESLQIYNINLLKFYEKYYNDIELSEFERAITLLTLKKRKDLEKISEGVEGLMEAKEEIEKLSNDIGIIGAYDYKKHLEWEMKQKAKEYVKDDLVKIEEGKKFIEDNTKILEEKDKVLEEKNKALEEKDKVLEEKDKVLEEKDKALEEKDKALEEKDKALEERDKALEEGQRSLEEDKKSFDKEKEELAKRMLDMNLTIDDIIKTTGLSKKQIEELKKS